MAPASDLSTWKTEPSKSMEQSTLHMANKNDKRTNKENGHEIKQNFSNLLMWKNLLFAFASYIRREKEWWQEEAEGGRRFPFPLRCSSFLGGSNILSCREVP